MSAWTPRNYEIQNMSNTCYNNTISYMITTSTPITMITGEQLVLYYTVIYLQILIHLHGCPATNPVKNLRIGLIMIYKSFYLNCSF